MSQESGSTKAKNSRTAKTPKSRASDRPERLKCSLLLTKENDLRLTVLASLKGTDRSTLLNSILGDALRGVVVSLRGQLATESGAGEGTPAEPDTDAA